MNASQFRESIIKPVLRYLEPEIPYSENAVELLMMTAAHESRLGHFIHQIGGPANGAFQMEPDTELDIFENYLEYRPELLEKISSLAIGANLGQSDGDAGIELCGNLFYATAMARLQYFRDSQSIPNGKLSFDTTIRDLAHYAKRVYNTEKGKAHADDYYHAYIRICL
jgi:hypothetical protein